jgi:predicted transcriptional regulator
MNPTEKRVLLHLKENGDNVPSNIADDIDRRQGSVQRSTRQLREQGLIRNKGRGVYTLTEEGKTAVEALEDLRAVSE